MHAYLGGMASNETELAWAGPAGAMVMDSAEIRAIVYESYGAPEVVTLARVARPAVGPRDVLVETRATEVSSGDARLRTATFPAGFGTLGRLMVGWSRPRRHVLGVSVAGVVVETGSEITEVSAGDRVVGMTGLALGAHAELCGLSADHCLVRLPDEVGFEDAATLPFGGLTALTYLEGKLAVRPGERLLVIGASGAVGAAAVQLGRLLGAHVTGVCSAGNASLVKGLGAERVIDYRSTDVFASSERWDVVLDTLGLAPLSDLRRVTTPRGRIGLVAAGVPQMLAGALVNLTSRQRCRFGPSSEDPRQLQRLVEWVRDGEYAPLIDCVLPLERAAEGHARVDTGHKRGSVLLSVGSR